MKKTSILFSIFILLTTLSCENEPLEGDFGTDNNVSCETAIQNTVDAALVFADVTDDNYTQLCIAYKEALQAQIQACGDTDGGLQTAVNALGDCSNVIATDGTFQVDFDEQTYVADIVTATIIDDVINISGLRGNSGELVTLTIFETTVGTYELGVTNSMVETNGASYIEDNGSPIWISVTNFIDPQGEITITEIDQINKTISGTFHFTGHNPISGGSKEFTNGSFTKIPYDSLQNNNDNTFFAKVDGVEFVEDLIQGFSTNLPGLSSIGIV